MQQRAYLINPRLHIEAAPAVCHHDGLPGFYVGHVLDQLILKFGELEWPVIAFTIMLVVCPHANNHRIVLGEVSRRLQRGCLTRDSDLPSPILQLVYSWRGSHRLL